MTYKRIHKYGTGEIIPDGAIYLGTVTQTEIEIEGRFPCKCHNDYFCTDYQKTGFIKCWYVWHYFLVEVDK